MWNEAELDEDTPPLVNNETGEVVIVPAGSTLPNSPEWSNATTLQYYWDTPSWGYPYIALEHFYKDTYVTYLPSQARVPSFSLFGLRVGATVAKQLQLTLSVKNLLDERAATYYNPGGDGAVLPDVFPESWWITRPRTISLSIQKNF
jgi:outer membrane receptor protein involved in Fe transport